jgi:hypothetical protein
MTMAKKSSTPTSTGKTLDTKLKKILAGKYESKDFIIADAKDADMAFGVMAPSTQPGATWGEIGPGKYRSRDVYLDHMRALVKQGVLDILLTSASNGQRLVKDGSLAKLNKRVTLAVRGNDATDIWNPRGSNYTSYMSRPFQTVNLKAVKKFCNLVLYSVTFNNDIERDHHTLVEFKKFREEASALGIRYFLEVFNPNAPVGIAPKDLGGFVNDHIVRALAGVVQEERPLFLKMAYNGGRALQELAEHDPSLVVGILGGGAGTTRDTFELLHRAEIYGGRVALFGRKIQRAESQLDIVRLMRPVLGKQLSPGDAVREYHQALESQRIKPLRSLEDDLHITDPVLLSE